MVEDLSYVLEPDKSAFSSAECYTLRIPEVPFMCDALVECTEGRQRLAIRSRLLAGALPEAVRERLSFLAPGEFSENRQFGGTWTSDGLHGVHLAVWVDGEMKKLGFQWRDAFDITELTKAARERPDAEGTWRAEDAEFQLDRLEPEIRRALVQLVDTDSTLVEIQPQHRV